MWVRQWLSNELGKDFISYNKSYPESLDSVTYEHLFEDHVLPFVLTFVSWMASNKLPKLRGVGNLNKGSKETYFKVLRLGADSRWWIDILYRFSCDSHRSALNDFS